MLRACGKCLIIQNKSNKTETQSCIQFSWLVLFQDRIFGQKYTFWWCVSSSKIFRCVCIGFSRTKKRRWVVHTVSATGVSCGLALSGLLAREFVARTSLVSEVYNWRGLGLLRPSALGGWSVIVRLLETPPWILSDSSTSPCVRFNECECLYWCVYRACWTKKPRRVHLDSLRVHLDSLRVHLDSLRVHLDSLRVHLDSLW